MGRKKSIFREVMKEHFRNNKEHFIRFLWNTRHIFLEIEKKNGDIKKVFRILQLVKEEEYRYRLYKSSGVRIPYPWEKEGYRVVMVGESEKRIEEIIRGKRRNPVSAEHIEEHKEIIKKFYTDIDNFFNNFVRELRTYKGSGEIVFEGELELKTGKDVYKIRYVCRDNFHRVEEELSGTSSRGRRGEPFASVAMYLLYEYFKQLKIKDIHKKIAKLVGEYSQFLFRNRKGSFLESEMVRKRIQWVKRRKEVLQFARKYMKLLDENKNGGADGI